MQDPTYFARKRRRRLAREAFKFEILTNEVRAGAAANTEVGILQVLNGSGTYTFTLTDDDGGRFDISGTKLRRSGSGTIAAGDLRKVAVQASNGVDTPTVNVFQIKVLA